MRARQLRARAICTPADTQDGVTGMRQRERVVARSTADLAERARPIHRDKRLTGRAGGDAGADSELERPYWRGIARQCSNAQIALVCWNQAIQLACRAQRPGAAGIW